MEAASDNLEPLFLYFILSVANDCFSFSELGPKAIRNHSLLG